MLSTLVWREIQSVQVVVDVTAGTDLGVADALTLAVASRLSPGVSASGEVISRMWADGMLY
jgi:hypothetical protein